MSKELNYLYKITNKINQKYYLGVHSTNNMDDGYMGSGKYIKRSIEKHGLENHVKEVLNYFEDRGELMEAEKRIVSIELIKGDTLCMNMKVGGSGGFGAGENSPWFNREFTEEHRKNLSKSLRGEKNPMFGRTGKNNPFYGKSHSAEYKPMKQELHGKEVEYMGNVYPSIREASRQTGVSRFYIKKGVAPNKLHKSCDFRDMLIDNEMTNEQILNSLSKRKKIKIIKQIVIFNQEAYWGVKQAAEEIGTSNQTIKKYGKYIDYKKWQIES